MQQFCRNRGNEWKKQNLLVETSKGKWAWVDKEEHGELPEKVKHLEDAMYAFKPTEWDTMVKVAGRILAGGKEVLERDETE